MINNYTYLFGSVYISINKNYCYEYLSDYFLSNTFSVDLTVVNKMVIYIDKFIDYNDIYFGVEEKIKVVNGIYYS